MITTNVTRLGDLSERGEVVGTRTDEHLNRIPFRWLRGRLTDLPGTPYGGSAVAVNERGDIAGETGLGFGTTHAVVWRDGRFTDLGTLGGNSSTSYDINERGQVSGTSDTDPAGPTPGRTHAFVWERGTFTDLSAGSTEASTVATITDTGYLVGHTVNEGGNISNTTEWRVR